VRRSLTSLLVGCLLVVAGVVIAPPASACSCAGIPTTKESFDRADAVFTGSLVSRQVTHPDGDIHSSGDPAVHVFAVDAVFKGDVHERQYVVSPDSGASCGLELSGDGPFVVFATKASGTANSPLTGHEDQYAAFLCGGTGPADAAVEAELGVLAGAPATPLPGDDVPRTTGIRSAVSWAPAAAWGVIGALLVVGLVLRRRRVRQR
jgi:hypothetical protein